MTLTRSSALPLVLALVACGDEDVRAATELLVPDDVELHWDASFNAEGDGLDAVVPVDLMVYDGLTGDAVEGAEVTLTPGDAALALAADEVDVVDPEDCDGCEPLWDAYRDRYFAVTSEVTEGALHLESDEDGIVRAYVVVDAFVASDTGEDTAFQPVYVQVSTEEVDEAFALVPR